MKGPEFKKGPILPNEFIDHAMGEIGSLAALKVYIYILRRTTGFHKEWDSISMTQFQHGISTNGSGKVESGTKLSRTSVIAGIAELEQLGLIEVKRTKTGTNSYRIL